MFSCFADQGRKLPLKEWYFQHGLRVWRRKQSLCHFKALISGSPIWGHEAILHTPPPFYVPKPQQINKSLQKYVVDITLLKTHSNSTLCSFFSSSLRKTHTCKKPFSVSSPLNVSAFGSGLGFWIRGFLFHLSLCLSIDILLLFFFGFFV
jgi:hypothetical protein